MSCLWMNRNSCRTRGESCQSPLKHTACLNSLASPLLHAHVHTHIQHAHKRTHVDGERLSADKCGLQCTCNPDPDKHRHEHTQHFMNRHIPHLTRSLILSDIHKFRTQNTPFLLPCSRQSAVEKSFCFYQVVISLSFFFGCQISDLSCHSKPWPHENTIVQQPEDGALHHTAQDCK